MVVLGSFMVVLGSFMVVLGSFMVGFPSFLGFGIRGRSYSNFLASTMVQTEVVVGELHYPNRFFSQVYLQPYLHLYPNSMGTSDVEVGHCEALRLSTDEARAR